MGNFYKRAVALIIFSFGLGHVGNASAVVINFDDLVPVHDPIFPCFCDNELTDEYAAQGLTFNDGFFDGSSSDGGLTYQNYLITGPYGQLIFSGELPTFVSMFVTSIHNDAIYFSAWGPDGFLETKKTPGFGGPFDDTPPEPNFHISFTAEKGIRFIDISAFYFRRTGAMIDDLTFTTTPVPEPQAWLLATLLIAPFLRKVLFKK